MSNKITVGTMVRLKGTQHVGMVASEPKPNLWRKLMFRVHAPTGAVYYWVEDRVEVID